MGCYVQKDAMKGSRGRGGKAGGGEICQTSPVKCDWAAAHSTRVLFSYVIGVCPYYRTKQTKAGVGFRPEKETT